MTNPAEMSPIGVVQELLRIVREIDECLPKAHAAYKEYVDAKRVYEKAYARARMVRVGPAHDKDDAAELATEDERLRRDAADVAFRYYEKMSKNLEKKLEAYRSIGTYVKLDYNESGLRGGVAPW